MKTVVVRNVARADADVVKRLGALGVATVHEAYGRSGLMKPYMRPVWAGGEAAGTAVTVLLPRAREAGTADEPGVISLPSDASA